MVKPYDGGSFDVIVVGAGHAGSEQRWQRQEWGATLCCCPLILIR